MDRVTKVLAIGLLVLAVCSPLSAQQTGEIRGKITEADGQPLPGVTVTASGPAIQGNRAAVSDRSGQYRLPLLPVGVYTLTFELPGYEKTTLIDQAVRLGFTVSLKTAMKPALIAEEVTVTAPNPLIDKTTGDNSYRLNSDDLARLPAQARTIEEVVALTPGVTGVRVNTVSGGSGAQPLLGGETGLPSFRGEGGVGNSWLVDGLPLRDTSSNSPAVRINYDAWEEVQIVSDGFGADQGQALGGFVNVVTKSGGNAFHGQLGGLVRDRRLRAERREQLGSVSLPETSRQQYFANLGGPIVEDKLWFFLSDNVFHDRDTSEPQTIGWLTVPAGDRRISTNNAFVKLIFTPYKNHTLSFTGTVDKCLGQSGGIGVPETYLRETFTDSLYRVNYQGILSSDTLITAAAGQTRTDSRSEPLSGDYGPPQYYWLDIGQITNNAFGGGQDVDRRTDLSVNLTRFLDLGRWGSHEVKAGLSYYRGHIRSTYQYSGLDLDPWPGNGFDFGADITWSEPSLPATLHEYGIAEMEDSTSGLGFYAEDNIALGRFALTLGLRTDTQRVFNNVGRMVWSWGPGDFLQPRASCSFDLTGDGRNVVKLACGLFSMPMPSLALTFFNTTYFNELRQYSWIGPGSPSDVQLADPVNWAFVWEQSTNYPVEVDPALKPDRLSKLLIEYDRQLGRSWALKVRGIYSKTGALLEDLVLYDPEAEEELEFVFTNFELKRRDYRALEIELNGRIPGRLMFNVSYTWSRAKGTNPGNYFEGGTWGALWGSTYDLGVFGDHPLMPEDSIYKEAYDALFGGHGGRGIGDEGWYGYLPYSVDHVVKVSGTWLAPYGLHIGASLEYLSGYHWEKKGLSGYGAYFTFPEGRGGRVTPPHAYADLAVEKDLRLSRGLTLGLGLNAYNLLNSQRPVSYVKSDNDLFGQVWARQLPRWAQVKVVLNF